MTSEINKNQERLGDNIQIVSFQIGEEEYGIPIEDIQEIVRLPQITRLPQSAEFIKGVINLRGNIIPVVDMREKLQIEEKEYSDKTRVIVVSIENKLVGLIVDTVSQVIVLSDEDIEEAPNIINGISRDYLKGIAKYDGIMIIILKIAKILTEDEIKKVKEVKEIKEESEK